MTFVIKFMKFVAKMQMVLKIAFSSFLFCVLSSNLVLTAARK